jgi:hypothetical protein
VAYTVEQLLERALTAEHELKEAQSEIARHHHDFKRIVAACDSFDTLRSEGGGAINFAILARELVAIIRGIVG